MVRPPFGVRSAGCLSQPLSAELPGTLPATLHLDLEAPVGRCYASNVHEFGYPGIEELCWGEGAGGVVLARVTDGRPEQCRAYGRIGVR